MRKIQIELDDETGKAVYMDDEVVLSSAGLFAFLQEAIAEENPLLAREAVSEAQKLFIRTAGRVMKRELVESMLNLGLERGFGVFSADPSFDFAAGEGLIIVENSVVARHARKVLEPACYHVAGIISGAAGILYDSDFACHEALCAAKGDRQCVFSLKRVSKAEKREFLKTMQPP